MRNVWIYSEGNLKLNLTEKYDILQTFNSLVFNIFNTVFYVACKSKLKKKVFIL